MLNMSITKILKIADLLIKAPVAGAFKGFKIPSDQAASEAEVSEVPLVSSVEGLVSSEEG